MRRAVRPAGRPAARIKLRGRDITTELLDDNASLVSLTVNDEAGELADAVTLEVDNRPDRNGAIFGAPTVGSELEIWLGYEPQPEYMGKYKIDRWEMSGPREVLRIEATAAAMTSEIKEKKRRSWHKTTIGAIVENIASEHALTAAVSEDQAKREIEHIDQQAESDMGFLTRLARRSGATFKLADGKAIFTTKGSATTPSGKEKAAVTIKPRDVSDWTFSQSERSGHKSVKATYHDHAKGKRMTVTAGSGSPAFRDRKLYGSKAEAEAAAKGKLGELNRGRKEGQISGPGNPELYAEGKVQIAGFHPDCDGGYFVKSVTHTFNGSGFISSATLETEKSEPDS